MDASAIQAIRESDATQASNNALTEHAPGLANVVFSGDGQKLNDLERMMPGRRRARGTMLTMDLDSLAEFVQQNGEDGGTAIFISRELMTVEAIMNFGTKDNPGHCDNTAKFIATATAEYKAMHTLLNASNGVVRQSTMAEFIEDWGEYIQARRNDKDIAKLAAVDAIRNLKVDQVRNTTSNEQKLSQSATVFESVSAEKNANLPTLITLIFKPYIDLPERTFEIRTGFTFDEASGKPRITVALRNAEEHAEGMGGDLAKVVMSRIKHAVAIKTAIYAGSYSSK